MIYEIIAGSRSYGLELPTSDIDLCRVAASYKMGYENNYNLIQIPADEFIRRLTGVYNNAIYYQWLFPSEVRSQGILTQYLQENREALMAAQLERAYNIILTHGEGLRLHADWLYAVCPKRLAYSTLYFTILSNYADGMTFAEAHKPTGELHDYLLSVRRGDIELADALSRNEVEHQKAIAIAGFYSGRPVNQAILNEASELIRQADLQSNDA